MTMSSLQLLVYGILVISVSCNSSFLNSQSDAFRQAKTLHSCWKPIRSELPEAVFKLSHPIYEYCSIMFHPTRESEVYANGVDLTSDNYDKFENHFREGNESYAVLTVCVQEAFSFQGPTKESEISLRCICKRFGCNIPKRLNDIFNFNKQPINLE